GVLSNASAATATYTISLHDALPISVASEIESGASIHINTAMDATGAVQLNGGRHVRIGGSRLTPQQDISVGALVDLDVSPVVEGHSSSSQSSKSSLLGKSSSLTSQTSARQVGSELAAGRDVLLVAGDDLRLRASTLSAERDVELRAGLLSSTGSIELSAAEDRE